MTFYYNLSALKPPIPEKYYDHQNSSKYCFSCCSYSYSYDQPDSQCR